MTKLVTTAKPMDMSCEASFWLEWFLRRKPAREPAQPPYLVRVTAGEEPMLPFHAGVKLARCLGGNSQSACTASDSWSSVRQGTPTAPLCHSATPGKKLYMHVALLCSALQGELAGWQGVLLTAEAPSAMQEAPLLKLKPYYQAACRPLQGSMCQTQKMQWERRSAPIRPKVALEAPTVMASPYTKERTLPARPDR